MALINVEHKREEWLKDDLDYQKSKAIKEINDRFQEQLDKAFEAYPKAEKDSFDTQRQEWVGWTGDNTKPTPFIDAIADGRGVDRLEQLEKVGRKTLSVAYAIGQKKRLEDSINSKRKIKTLKRLKRWMSKNYEFKGA